MNKKILDFLGIDLSDPNIPTEVLLSLSILFLTIVSVLCFINLMCYFIILRISDTEMVQNYIKDKRFLFKMVNFYKKISIWTIAYEIVFYIFVNYYIIYICFKISNNYIKWF